MNSLTALLSSQDLSSDSPARIMSLLANHRLAQKIIVSPKMLRNALKKADPQGKRLFDSLGIRIEYSFANLCHLALYDNTLMYAMSLVIEQALDNDED